MDWKKWLGLQMTPERFTRKVSKLMQAVKPDLNPVPDLENFRLLISEGNFFNLHNAYHAYQMAPRKERDAVLEQFVLGMLNAPEVPTTFAEVRPLLMPALRRRSMLDYLRREAPSEKPGDAVLAYRDLGPDTVLTLTIDAERSMSLVMESKLEEWGVSFETALEAAMENLRDRSVDNFSAVDGAPGVIRSNWCDAYDSSRILLPDRMFRGAASGSPVIMIPTRELLLLAPDNNPESQLAMLDLAGQALNESNRWCSTAMYQVVNGTLALFTPQDSQVRERKRSFERNVAMSDYAEQKEQMDKAHERAGTDIFVGTFGALDRDGVIFTYCTWTEGVESVLPKTDLVALARSKNGEDFEFVLADWSMLMQGHAGLLQQTPDFPARFQVSGFPTALFEELMAEKQPETA